MVAIEDCSMSWSSEDDNDTTARPLDKVNHDVTSDAIDEDTSCILYGDDDDSCSGYESDACARSSTSPHCFMSRDDAKVSIGGVIIDSGDPVTPKNLF
jgi:hypothetical protein